VPARLSDPTVTAAGHVVYLHGFASSPASSKARRFARELAARGIGFSCPDLNEPSFENLTVTRMLADVGRLVAAAPAGPVALVGSSLGGFVALHAAEQDAAERIDRLVLLAPAVEFGGNRLRQLGEHGLEEWRRAGRIRVFHYAANEEREIGYRLYEDAARYDAFAVRRVLPTLVYQGRADDTVDPASVTRWASSRPHVTVRLLDDDHQLAASMDEIWTGAAGLLT
jgi:pimeloyl-ACP methyl ester carboxylesterase